MPVLMGDEGSILGRIGMSTLAKPALRSKQEITHAHGKTFRIAGFKPAAVSKMRSRAKLSGNRSLWRTRYALGNLQSKRMPPRDPPAPCPCHSASPVYIVRLREDPL